jgi:hypothetical protein
LQRMLAGTAGLKEGKLAHHLDVQCILHEVSTIVRSWAKSKILDFTVEADIRAEHGSRTKVTISNETKESIDAIIGALNQLCLTDVSSYDDDLRVLLELNLNCTKETLAEELETWTQIEETSDFINLKNQDIEETISEEAIIASLTRRDAKQPDSSDNSEPSDEEGEMKSILDLDVTGLCSSLVEVQQLLEQHGVSAAAECIEQGRNLLYRTCWNAKYKVPS